VGLRPLTPDTLPVLGPVPGVSGVYLVTGHGPTGLTLGAYSGKLVAARMLGQAAGTDLSPFSVARFR
jgi:D-amino-acid dehydrogenase